MANLLERLLNPDDPADQTSAEGRPRVFINGPPTNKIEETLQGAGGRADTGNGIDIPALLAKLGGMIQGLGQNAGSAGVEGQQQTNLNTVRDRLLGTGSQERFQTWPEKLIRSGLSLPGDVLSGAQPMPMPGARTEDMVELPRGSSFSSPWQQPADRVIERAQDTAGLMGGGSIAGTNAAEATLGSGPIRPVTPVVTPPASVAPAFYSAVEHSVMNAPQPKMGYDQWMGYLKNQPGVKGEELAWMGLNEKPPFEGKSISKEQMQEWVDNHKVEIKEINKDGAQAKNVTQADLDRAEGNARRTGDWTEYEDTMVRFEDQELNHDGDTKFSSYQLPGGENYREVLFTLPLKVKNPITPELRAAHKEYHDLWADKTKIDTKLFNAQIEHARANPSFKLGIDPLPDTPRFNKLKADLAEKISRLEELRTKDDRVAWPSLEQAADRETKAEGSYQSSHWDEPNVLAHTRLNDRVIDGKKSLHVEEIQSDWHQEGRKKGYKDPKLQAAFDRLKDNKQTDADLALLMDSGMTSQDFKNSGVPDAPFKTSWPDLVLKRLVREAAEKGYDQISWTPGEAQAARYDLSKQINALRYEKNADGTYNLGANKNPETWHEIHIADNIPESKLADHVGKDVAEKIIKGEGKPNVRSDDKSRLLEGVDLKIGGEGMKAFYDKMLVDKANALGKKFGAKVKQDQIGTGEYVLPEGGSVAPDRMHLLSDAQKSTLKQKTSPIFVLPITPALRDAAIGKGFPLFTSGIPFPLQPVDGNPWKDKK